MAKQINKKDISVKDPFGDVKLSADEMKTSVIALKKEFVDLKTELKGIKFKGIEDVEKLASGTTKASKSFTAFNEAQKAIERTEKDRIKLLAKLKEANSSRIDVNTKLKVQLQEQNKVNKEIAKESLGLINIYSKTSTELNKLIKRQQDLSLKKELGNKLTRQETKELTKLTSRITKLDSALKRVDKTNGRFQRNVGNYPQLFKNSGAALKGFVGAFGLVGGIQLFASVITDTFKRIREFDKEIVNLAAILGESRKEVADLEKAIVRVAGSSIKTSNEVAKLATTLVTLGKTKGEILLLLEPINNLSIGLEATSEEAGELLVQTLNAFGKGAESAGEFADIIAKIRTSTALDFQRIKDALGFLAPVAKAAGVSFEETGAILGVLVDNGIKAARAGRLMSTTFLKLADEGSSLEEALEKVNEATARGADEQELLSLASKLFGKESAALGLILAANTEKVADLTAEFENAGGSLEDLTNRQLESMDAKLKILDSTWESFILGVENGDSFLSKVFIKTIDKLAIGIDNVRFSLLSLNAQVDETGFEKANERFQDFTKSFDEGATKADKLAKAQIALKQVQEGLALSTSVINEDYGDLNATTEEIEEKYSEFIKVQRISLREFWNLRDSALANVSTNKELIKLYSNYVETLSKVTKENEELNKSTEESKKKTDELNGLIEKQIKVVNRLKKAVDQATGEDQIISLKVDLKEAEVELERLKTLGDEAEIEADKTLQRRLDAINKTEQLQISAQIDRINKEIALEGTSDKRKLELLNTRYDLERRALEDQADYILTNDELTAEERETIQQKLQNDIANLEQGRVDDVEKANQAIIDAELDLKKKRIVNAVETAQQMTEIFGDAFDEAFDKRLDSLDDEEAATRENLSNQQSLAEQGFENQASFERQKLAEIEAERRQVQKRRQLVEEGEALALAYLNFVQVRAKEDPDTAPTKALQDVATVAVIKGGAKALANLAVGSAYDGTEDTGTIAGGGLDGKGGRLWMLHDNEGVATKDANTTYSGLIGAMNTGNVEGWVLQNMATNPNIDIESKSNEMTSLERGFSQLSNDMKSVKDAVKNIPHETLDFDKLGNAMKIRTKNGVKQIITHQEFKKKI